MPSSPRTPRHSRHSSIAINTPAANDPTTRRNSKASVHSPRTPNRQSFHRSDSINIDVLNSAGPTPHANGLGLGNLADELADAWGSEEEDEEPDMNFQEAARQDGETTRDSGVDVTSSPVPKTSKPAHLMTPTVNRGHRRQQSDYDGSDYGGDSDLDSPGIPTTLQRGMDMVESLARRGTETTGTERDGVVGRVIDGLKDLGGQSGVEGGATR
jgi:hypothetical protein